MIKYHLYLVYTFTNIYVCTIHVYVHSFFSYIDVSNKYFKIASRSFPKVFSWFAVSRVRKKYSSLKRYPQSWSHDSTSLDPFDPIRLDVTRINSDPTVEMDPKLRWKNAVFFRKNAGYVLQNQK